MPVVMVSAIAAAGVAAWSEDHIWVVIAALCAAGSLAFYLAKDIIKPFLHWRILKKRPIDSYFIIEDKHKYHLGYLHQDDRSHKTLDLTVPSHRDDIYIQLIMQARTAFTLSHLVFGFDGLRGKYPFIKHYSLGFIKVGISDRHPGEWPSHYIDHHDRYHITDTTFYPKKQWKTVGFKITTRHPGVYRGRLELSVDGVEFTDYVNLYVEEEPERIMRCVDHKDCFIRPLNQEIANQSPPSPPA
jgi:hypothetical protein